MAGRQTRKDDFILTTFRPNLRDKYRHFDIQNEKFYWAIQPGLKVEE